MILEKFIYIISDILSESSHKCTHKNVSPEVECAYCADCGKLIKNEWYITRCNCCGVKMKAMVKNGKIVPQNNFCTNCGKHDYSIEKIEHINFIDINFAALIQKECEDTKIYKTTTCWEEKISEQPKLLVQY